MSAASFPSPRRARARRGEGERLREEILAAAERLLLRTGDQAAVSIRAIADEVGVTPPSIYLHFADKAELLFAVSERNFTRLGERLAEAVAGATDPLEVLAHAGRAYIAFGLENPEHYRIMFMTKLEPEYGDDHHERMMSSASFDLLVRVVADAIQAGRLRHGDPVRVAASLWASVHGVTSVLLTNPRPPCEPADLIEQTLATLMFGVAAPPSPQAEAG